MNNFDCKVFKSSFFSINDSVFIAKCLCILQYFYYKGHLVSYFQSVQTKVAIHIHIAADGSSSREDHTNIILCVCFVFIHGSFRTINHTNLSIHKIYESQNQQGEDLQAVINTDDWMDISYFEKWNSVQLFNAKKIRRIDCAIYACVLFDHFHFLSLSLSLSLVKTVSCCRVC